MIVIAIVGILATIGVPAMSDLIVSNRMKSLSLDIYSGLILARSEAVKRNLGTGAGNVSMIANGGDWQSGWKVCVDTNADGSCAGDPVLTVGEVDPSLTLSRTAGAVVTYGRDGRLTSTAGGFRIKAVGYANSAKVPMRCVDISVSGRPNTRVDSNQNDSDGCN